MKINQFISFVISYGALVKLINWSLNSLKFQENSAYTLSFFLSNILALIAIIIFVVYQLQKDAEKTKSILKSKGYLKEEDLTGGFMNKLIGKRGYVDARMLLVIVALLIIWLLWKAGKLPF